VRQVNPDALAIAAKFDGMKPSKSQPLAGIPILVKDNIATADKQHTTAGSLALAGAGAKRDATVVKRLRAAGAVILGKANLTEFANILAIDMPAGYSSLGGQVKNPYARARRQGRADRAAGRVERGLGGRGRGRAVRRGDRHRDLGLAALAGDPERARHRQADRRPHQPRRHHPDRAQPGHRRPADPHRARRGDPAQRAGGARPADPATRTCSARPTIPPCSTRTVSSGARIGLPSDPADPANDVYYGKLSPRSAAVMKRGRRDACRRGRRDRARQHPDDRLDGRSGHRDGGAQPQPGKQDQVRSGAPARSSSSTR
jgi:amidase